MKQPFFLCSLLLLLLAACGQKRPPQSNGAFAPAVAPAEETGGFGWEEITASGEVIGVTFSGPDTYYDYHGRPLGLQFALAADFSRHEGLRLRMETARDTAALIRMLQGGEADFIALLLPEEVIEHHGLQAAGVADTARKESWAVRSGAEELVQALDSWYASGPLPSVSQQEKQRFTESRQVKRKVRAPFISKEKGIISTYDAHFKQAAAVTGWDWRLIAAQCYQESGFDPAAVSWAGACGLMQIMPGTGQELGVTPDELYHPEINVSAAARYIVQLNSLFSDIRSHEERLKFVLAAYNGGAGHVRDAMALTRKSGKNPQRWDDVAHYVLRLSEARYYRDPVVKYGYMIGSETCSYVEAVMERWRAYGGTVYSGGASGGNAPGNARPVHKKNRFSKERKIYTPEELRAE